MLSRRLLIALSAAAPLALAGKATLSADAYPSRVITMVVPYAAGGPRSDTVARLLAEPMTRGLGQQVIVENVGGASGTIGAARVARADPDGYTILLHTSAHATNTLLYRKLRFDAAADFAPVGVTTIVPMTVVGRKDLPPNSAAELLEHIRANPEKITIGNAGVGGPSHLCGMLLMSRLDTPMITVPYKGTGPAITDLLGGQIDLICDRVDQHGGPHQVRRGEALCGDHEGARSSPARSADPCQNRGWRTSRWSSGRGCSHPKALRRRRWTSWREACGKRSRIPR